MGQQAPTARRNRRLIKEPDRAWGMFVAVVDDVLNTVGPFVIPVVVFALGALGYLCLYLYYRWRDGDLLA
jgi:hypothetical protein